MKISITVNFDPTKHINICIDELSQSNDHKIDNSEIVRSAAENNNSHNKINDNSYRVQSIRVEPSIENYGDHKALGDVVRFAQYILSDYQTNINKELLVKTIQEKFVILMSSRAGAVKYFSSASMRLSAIIRLLDGSNESYVLNQYVAMHASDRTVSSMYPSRLTSLLRSCVQRGLLTSSDRIKQLQIGLFAFDKKNSEFNHDISKIQLNFDAREYTKSVLLEKITSSQ